MAARNIARGTGVFAAAAFLAVGLRGRGLPSSGSVFAAGGLLLCLLCPLWLGAGEVRISTRILRPPDTKKSKPA